MKFRLSAPAYLVDINRLDDLKYVREENGSLVIGALTRHSDIEANSLVKKNAGLLASATHHVETHKSDTVELWEAQLLTGDPASDIPSALLALSATVVVTGPEGTRDIPIDDFFVGFLETDLKDDEMLTQIKVPSVPDAKWSFQNLIEEHKTGLLLAHPF